jgi:mannose-6-phosphate isomerase-like protein (cupin superfamily)
MKNLSRRDLVAALPALSLLGSVLAETSTAVAQSAGSTAAGSIPAHCRVYNFEDLPRSTNATGAITHSVMSGNLPTGEYFEIHETTLGPGHAPHPPHHHIHNELMFIREGSVEFSMGNSEHVDHSAVVGPGGICYARSGEMHGLKNTGTVPANYFVIAIGKEPA